MRAPQALRLALLLAFRPEFAQVDAAEEAADRAA
jgi:hypothetical protein